MDFANVEISVSDMYGDRFKKLYFNELTILPACSDETKTYQSIWLYGQTFKGTASKLGTKDIIFAGNLGGEILYEGVSLKEFCRVHRQDPRVSLIISSLIRSMFNVYNDGDGKNVSVETDNGLQESRGMTAAYCHDVPSIGFYSDEYWNAAMYNAIVTSVNDSFSVRWPCLTDPVQMEDEEFRQWILDHTEVNLVRTELTEGEKPIKLAGTHHGNNVLMRHAKLLIKNEYVEGIVNSADFRGYSNKYIYKVRDGGLIDICLIFEKMHYSLVVKTTGRNLKETEAIADILERKYGHK